MNVVTRKAAFGPLIVTLMLVMLVAGCAKKQPPIARPTPPPPDTMGVDRPPTPPEPVPEPPPIVPPEPTIEELDLAARSLDELNRESPFEPVFFSFDSYEVEPAGQSVLQANAEVLKRYSTWVVTIEGHCDERGTAEYNLSLGEKRALAARDYLLSLGVPASRLRTVSYGKEFPFDPGTTEEAYARNRRAHFVITAK